MKSLPQNSTPVNDTLFDPDEVRKALQVLTAPGQVVELRIIDAKTVKENWRPFTASGYYSSIDALVSDLGTIAEAPNIYITLQSLNKSLLGRAVNRLRTADEMKRGATTKDTECERYRWLLVDADVQRPAGISTTDSEHDAALHKVQLIRETLSSDGWPEPVLGDSGNGWHLQYSIDLPISDKAIVEQALKGLAARFDDEQVHIDQTVFNPARICKLYGTRAGKGDELVGIEGLEDRPHRLSRLVDVPDTITPVSRELLIDLAPVAVVGTPSVTTPKTKSIFGSATPSRDWTMEDFISRHHIATLDKIPYNGGYKWRLVECPFCHSTDRGAVLFERSGGELCFNCSHNSCEGKDWKDYRPLYEPDAYTEHKPSTTAASNGDGHQEPAQQQPATKEDAQAVKLVKMAEECATFFHTSKGELYARIKTNSHAETMVIGETFKRWITHRYVTTEQSIPNSTALASAISVLEAEAEHGSEKTREVYLRLAQHHEKLYLDLANDAHQVVEITSSGWEIINDAPIEFRHPNGMLPLPTPIHGGTLEELRPFVNCTNEDWILVKAWLVGTLHPTGPYAILDLTGERGSAKSTTEKVLRMLIDPSKAPLRKEPKDDQTFAIMAHNNYVVAFDNLSHVSSRFSDSMCTLATGSGDAYRKHYSNDAEEIFDAKRPQIFNGIEELATRGDLIDRCIILKLPVIDKLHRRDERTFWNEFNLAHPLILGALLDAVSMALKNLSQTTLEGTPRMADFALWVQAAESALSCEPGAFIQAYDTNRDEGVSIEIEASPIGSAILALMRDRPIYDDLASTLLKELKASVDEELTHTKSWPKDARALSGAIKRLAPSLRARGIAVLQKRTNKGGNITLSKLAKSDANYPKSDANLGEVTQKSEEVTLIQDDQKEARPDFIPKVTQSDAKTQTSLLLAAKEKEKREEQIEEKKNVGNLRHFASPLIFAAPAEGVETKSVDEQIADVLSQLRVGYPTKGGPNGVGIVKRIGCNSVELEIWGKSRLYAGAGILSIIP